MSGKKFCHNFFYKYHQCLAYYVSVPQDLKRQLLLEQKRVERLQDRLREWAETTSNMSEPTLSTQVPSLHHLILCPPQEADRSSISSWSLMSGEGRGREGRETSSPLPAGGSSPEEELPAPAPSITSNVQIEKENEALVSKLPPPPPHFVQMVRVAALQQEKWQMEERLVR